jgi:predicted nuclease of predicted toxin-antitoxin system
VVNIWQGSPNKNNKDVSFYSYARRARIIQVVTKDMGFNPTTLGTHTAAP